MTRKLGCGIAILAAAAMGASAQERQRPRIDVQHYVIEAEVNQNTQMLNAKAEVRFVPMEDNVRNAVFELNSALNVSKVQDASGQQLSVTRNRPEFTVTVAFPEPLQKEKVSVLTFFYDGRLTGQEESPVYGIRFASIQTDYAYLMYPARWFPVSGYSTDRFSADLKITVGQGAKVIASGIQTSTTLPDGRMQYASRYTRSSFPGSIGVVKGNPQKVTAEGVTTTMYFRGAQQEAVSANGNETGRMMTYFTSLFGLPPDANLTFVETEDGAPVGYSSPGIVFLSPSSIRTEPNIRVLANQLSRQWWGVLVSPLTREHIWLVNSLARYSEVLYIEHAAGKAQYDSEMQLIYTDALTIDNVPVIQGTRYDDFSPEYWALTASKGAAALNMLRYVIGDQNFLALLKKFPDQYAWQPAATVDFRKVAEGIYGQSLDYFFIEWIQSSGAPEFQLEYTIFRTQKGFRVMGKVTQDLDTFRMPVELRVQTEGNPEEQKVEVAGTSTEFVVETFGKATSVVLDPDHRVLRFDNPTRVAVAIRRGEQFAEINEFSEALKEYQKALEVNRNSSLAHYRIAEIFFLQNNYQSAANEFREVLNGDLQPAWTEVWSHIHLGKIFDVTGQRERAVNEYRQAIRTKDNTQGAQEEGAKYLKTPYEREGSKI